MNLNQEALLKLEKNGKQNLFYVVAFHTDKDLKTHKIFIYFTKILNTEGDKNLQKTLCIKTKMWNGKNQQHLKKNE